MARGVASAPEETVKTSDRDDHKKVIVVMKYFSQQATTREVEVQAEEESSFLARHLAQIQGVPGTLVPGGSGSRTESPLRQSPAVQRTGDRRVSANSATASPQTQMSSPKKVFFSLQNLFCVMVNCLTARPKTFKEFLKVLIA